MARTDYNGLKQYVGLILLCVVLYTPGLTTLPPVDRDEARFAQATRQMLESRDFIRIRFQQKPRHKKPIGIHWLQALSVKLTGSPNRIWPYRIPSLLGAMLAAILTFVFGKNLFDQQTGLFGAIVTASSLLLVVEAHQATTDAALLAAVVAAQGSLGTLYVRNRHGETVGLGTAITFWTAQGIGILLKGPIVPLVSLLTILTLLAVDRSASHLRGLRVKLGIPLVVLIVSPWAIAITMATDGTFFGDAIFWRCYPLGSVAKTYLRPRITRLSTRLLFACCCLDLLAGVAVPLAGATEGNKAAISHRREVLSSMDNPGMANI